MTRPILLIGAGGHGKSLLTAIKRSGRAVLGAVDSDQSRWNTLFQGISILGGDAVIADHKPQDVDLANGIGLAVPGLRRHLFERYAALGYYFPAIVDASAIVADDVILDDGAQILAGAIVQAGTRIGVNSIINTGAIVDHDCRIGGHAFVAPGAVLAGGVTLGDNVLVGVGASLRPGVCVGQGAIIGVGAAVITDIGPNMTALGVPAKSRI